MLEARDRLRDAARCQRRALGLLGDAAAAAPDPDIARLALRARTPSAAWTGLSGRTPRRSAGIGRRSPRPDAASAAAIRYVSGMLNNLGVLRKAQGRYAEAAAIYRRALALVSPRDRESLATLAHNLGGIEHARGHFARAEPHARRSVRLRTALLGPDHPAVAADQAALAAIIEATGPPR